MDNQNPYQPKWIIPVAVIVLLIALYAGIAAYIKKSSSNSSNISDSNDINSGVVANVNSNNITNNNQPVANFKNGTYTSSGSYSSPGGREQVAVTITLQNDIVTDSSVSPMPASPNSGEYQNQFLANYKQFVIGKNISNLNLSKVAGSSLTPKGFNAALEQIKAQAKA